MIALEEDCGPSPHLKEKTAAHPAVKGFVRALDGIDRSKRRTEVFADFCELAYCALAQHAPAPGPMSATGWRPNTCGSSVAIATRTTSAS